MQALSQDWLFCPCFIRLKGAIDSEMVDQVPLSRENSSSVPVTNLHMMKDKRSDSSGQKILYCCGNNEHAIYFEPGLLPGLLYCLFSGDPAYFNMTLVVLLNIELDFFP